MLTSSTVPRPKSHRFQGVAKCALSPAISGRIQTRTFRFGLWASCLDPTFQRELQRRHRKLKYKYLDSINRRLSWHDHPFAEEPKAALRRLIAQYSSPVAGRQHSFWVNQDELDRRTSHCKSSSSALDRYRDQLRKYSQAIVDEDAPNKSKPESVSGDRHVKSKTDAHQTKSVFEKPSKTHGYKHSGDDLQNYVIDPITNRKVLQSDHEHVYGDIEPESQTFKSYRSQFAPWSPPATEQERAPVHSNGEPPVAELDKYAEKNFDDWSAVDKTHPSSHPEAQLYVFEDLSSRSEECSLNHLPAEESVEEYDDLHKYQPAAADLTAEPQLDSSIYKSDNSSSSVASHHVVTDSSSLPPEIQNELLKYKAFLHDDVVVKQPSLEPPPDLAQYQTFSPDTHIPESSAAAHHDENRNAQDRPFEQYGDLEKYEAFKLRDSESAAPLERDSVAESLEEFDLKEQKTTDVEASNASNSYNSASQGVLPKMDLPRNHIFSKHYAEKACPPTTERRGQNIDDLEQQMRELSASSDAIDQEINHSLQKSWRESSFLDGTSSTGLNSIFDHDTQARAPSEESNATQDISDGISHGFLEPALERQQHSRLEPFAARGTASVKGEHSTDLFSKDAQGLETSFSEECGGKKTMPIYTRTYSSKPEHTTNDSGPMKAQSTLGATQDLSRDCYDRDPEIDGPPPSSNKPARESLTGSTQEPTVYKILAYDPNMQTVNIAETSSVVPDQASPLSPTEVLLRLSNPAKFFPHFAPLKAEGFEIVSGSGDVLVFRQMRLAKAACVNGGASVNPIDMMGKTTPWPNAAAFASPTGFVNYDLPAVEVETPEPPFRSNIDVRREEPVFSGTRSSWSEGKKPKKARRRVASRMLVAGAWVAGLTYAIGVVSEFFTTGGSTGGPQGFAPS
ncbi:hypothetical protein F5Y18DRAFT_55785 [Xylariaceae sp. FL1019]|nr:hypothetical protein F5Y18DRAFT_55785 [Xylariaceae sp. FL1019]